MSGRDARNLHRWGVYSQERAGWLASNKRLRWALVSHHKTVQGALRYAQSGEQIRRTSEKGYGWGAKRHSFRSDPNVSLHVCRLGALILKIEAA